MKKMLELTFAAMLFFSCFASCAKNEYEEEWEPPKKTEQIEAQSAGSGETEPEKKIKTESIDFILMGYGSLGRPRNKLYIDKMLEAVNESLAEDLNAQISFTWASYDSYEEDAMKIITSGEGTDVVDVMYPGSGVFNSLLDNGMLRDIREDFKMLMPETYDFLYDKYPFLDEYLLTEEKQYFIPMVNAYPVRYYMLTVKELYRQYGEKVATLNDYENYMDWISDAKPELIPGYVQASDVLDAYFKGKGYIGGFASTFYRRMDDPLQADIPMEQLPEFAEAYDMLVRWHEKGFHEGTEGGNYAEPALSGKLASILIYPSSYTRTETIHLPPTVEYEYVVLYPDTTMLISPEFWGPSVLSEADAPEAALKFYELLYSSREYYDLIQYGIEGENYKKIGEKISAPPVSSKTIIGWWGSGSFYNYTMERPLWSEPDDFTGFFEEIAFDNTISPVQLAKKLGIKESVVTDDDKKDEMSKYFSDVITPMMDYRTEVCRDFYNMLFQGDFSMTADEAREMLNEGNADELVEAMNHYRSLGAEDG